MKFVELTLIMALISLASQNAWAVCTTLIRGPVAFDVRQCTKVNPETAFPLQDSKYNFIRDLPPANRNTLYASYRGILLKGVVTRSQAVAAGLSDEKGALQGEAIAAFVAQGASECSQILGKQVSAQLEQACCDEGGNSPCLLGTDYVLKSLQVLDKNAAQKSLQQQRSPEAQALYREASQKLSKFDKKGAAKVLEKLRSQGQLDAQGQYVLGKTYRELDRCGNALAGLAPLQQMFETNNYWVEAAPYVRGGAFLYARCLSVSGKASEAVLALQGFLVEPKRYQKEIKESLSHADFGYISTSKPYITYRASASKALAEP